MLIDILTGNGLLNLPWWGYVVVTLVATHATIACVTLFLHRSQAHRSVEFHPVITHAMRFWLWLTTGMVTREWVAVHRKHHATADTDEDPHSPVAYGILKVLLEGTELYREASRDETTKKIYGRGTPEDWVERNIYTRRSAMGVTLLFFTNYLLFGFWGISIWGVQMLWIPFFAAGVINGGGHFFGYRNYETPDQSTNLGNIGLLIGGEELHNNHHAFPTSAKMSAKSWEFDVGWLYIKTLEYLKLARVKQVMPPQKTSSNIPHLGTGTVQALAHGRLHVMTEYVRTVMHPIFKHELSKAKNLPYQQLLKKIKKPFLHHENISDAHEHRDLKNVLENSMPLKTVYEFRHHLQFLWHDLRHDHEKFRKELLRWCTQAEKSGLHLLEDFARRMKAHTETVAQAPA